jgi:hypothetical protein
MKEDSNTVYITEKDLDYYSNPLQTANEEDANSGILSDEEFAEISKTCITLDEFDKMWKESINRLIPNP